MTKHEEVSVQFYQDKLEANSQSLVFSRLADCYRKKGEIQQAIGVCIQGLAIHPDYVTGRVILGRCYLEQEKLKEAIAEFIHVVELDRRNQVAVKMIADVYARQGMKEKAGDLYAYLLRMDPDNQSLAKLSQTSSGNGETNVKRILGIAPRMQGPDVSAEAGQQAPPDAPSDAIFDVDKTIQMDIVSKQPEGRLSDTAELGEMLIKTQKFDTEELNTAADAGSYRVEETIADLGAKQGDADTITGDDISSRMAMIFGEEEAGAPDAQQQTAEMPAEAMDVVSDDADVQKVTDNTVATGYLDSKEPAAAPSVVSGSDITSRIEQLFGDRQPSGEPEADADSTMDFTPPPEAYEPGPSAEESSAGVTGSPELMSTDPAVASDKQKAPESGSISGEDVTDRLNEMFSDASSITGSLAEIGKMLDQQIPVIDEMEQAVAGAEMRDDLLAENSDMSARRAADGPANEQELLLEESPAAVSGDDVALRLETIFEEGEKADEEAGTGAISIDEDTIARPEEDTRPPVEVDDSAIVIGGDLYDGDIHDVGDATLFGVETLTDDAKDHKDVVDADGEAEEEPEIRIDDAVPQEAQPEMSGDDVVGRLEELFSDNLMEDGGLESIPEGDKDDGEVNQGFYTMSGENAQTTDSEDSLLSELDESDSEGPEKETLDITRDAGDKTVLMEQDGGDMTLAASEEETIMSGLLPKQPALAEDGDDVFVNEATQINLPAAEEQSQTEAGTQYSIPDHVLTPTLADIYYQQGQPKLALQIYNRLLEADPDNERIVKRTREIEHFIAMQETEETVMVDSGRKKDRPPLHETVEKPEPGAHGAGKIDSAGKPLSGVRIKKVYKNRIKKNR
jgi:tetratricopeptide (TPR) repeat protein